MGARARHVVILVLAAATAAGCSGADSDPADDATPTTSRSVVSSSESVASNDEPDPDDDGADGGAVLGGEPVESVDDNAIAGEVRSLVRSIQADVHVRYAGFDVVVESIDVGFDPAGFAVAYVTMAMTNNTNRDDRLQTAVEVASQGHVAGIDRDVTPIVPSGGTAPGAVSIRLDPASFSFDDAVLFIGRPDRQRVEVPLGSVGELIDRLPVQHEAGLSASDEVSMLTIDEVVTAWDMAEPRGQAEPGSMFLHITGRLDSTVETVVNDRSIDLIMADGSLVEAEAGTSGPVAAGEPFTITAAFTVVDPPEGDYVLRYTERFDRGVLDIPFTID